MGDEGKISLTFCSSAAGQLREVFLSLPGRQPGACSHGVCHSGPWTLSQAHISKQLGKDAISTYHAHASEFIQVALQGELIGIF